MVQHGRVYKDAAEKERRHKIFKNNVKYIENFNSGVGKGTGYKLAVNKFSDLTNDEFRSMYTGYSWKIFGVLPVSSDNSSLSHGNSTDLPSSIDWRENGAVTPFKNQGHCSK